MTTRSDFCRAAHWLCQTCWSVLLRKVRHMVWGMGASRWQERLDWSLRLVSSSSSLSYEPIFERVTVKSPLGCRLCC
jgi:hypothetical protein